MGFQLFLTSLIALFLLSIPLCIMSHEPPAGGAVHGRDADVGQAHESDQGGRPGHMPPKVCLPGGRPAALHHEQGH